MKIKEIIERDCCQTQDREIIREEFRRSIFQCKYCKKKVIEVWCGPGNNDFMLKEYKK